MWMSFEDVDEESSLRMWSEDVDVYDQEWRMEIGERGVRSSLLLISRPSDNIIISIIIVAFDDSK